MAEGFWGGYDYVEDKTPANSHKAAEKSPEPARKPEDLKASFETIRDSKKALVLEACKANVAKLRSLIAPIQQLCPELKLECASTASLSKLHIGSTYDLLLELKIGNNSQIIGVIGGDTSINVSQSFITPTSPVREFGKRNSNTDVYNLGNEESCAKFQSQALYMAAITTGTREALIEMGLTQPQGIKTLRKNVERTPSL